MPRRSSAARGARLRGFPPVIDARVETLILGSFPSEASLAAGQYYAHPRNQFWPIMGALLGEPLVALPYAQRLARLLAHQVGLWDVLGACHRDGSLDAAIRAPQPNAFAPLLEQAPRLRRVLFNGQTAGRFAPRFAAAGLQAQARELAAGTRLTTMIASNRFRCAGRRQAGRIGLDC